MKPKTTCRKCGCLLRCAVCDKPLCRCRAFPVIIPNRLWGGETVHVCGRTNDPRHLQAIGNPSPARLKAMRHQLKRNGFPLCWEDVPAPHDEQLDAAAIIGRLRSKGIESITIGGEVVAVDDIEVRS